MDYLCDLMTVLPSPPSMASPVQPSRSPSPTPCIPSSSSSSACAPYEYPLPVDHLLHQLSIICASLIGWMPTGGGRRSAQGTPLPISALGMAYLFLGMSSSLMLVGSFAFMVGFMLMPLFFLMAFLVCVGALFGNLRAPGIALCSLINAVSHPSSKAP